MKKLTWMIAILALIGGLVATGCSGGGGAAEEPANLDNSKPVPAEDGGSFATITTRVALV